MRSAVVGDEVPGAGGEAKALTGERALQVEPVNTGAALLDSVAAGADEGVELAQEHVVSAAQGDPLLADTGSSAVDVVVAPAAENRDRSGRRREDAVVAVVSVDRGRRVAVTERADVADGSDAIAAVATADRDGDLTCARDTDAVIAPEELCLEIC